MPTATSVPDTKSVKAEEAIESYRVWTSQSTTALRLMILEINSSRQVIWNLLREVPTSNGSSSRSAAKAVHSKLARAETDLIYAITHTENSFRAFVVGESASPAMSQTSQNGHSSTSFSGKDRPLTMSSVKPFRIKIINFLDDADYKEWTNLMMNAQRRKVMDLDAAKYDVWAYSHAPHVQTSVKLIGRAEDSVMASTAKVAAAYRSYVTRYHNVKPNSRNGTAPVGRGRRGGSYFQYA